MTDRGDSSRNLFVYDLVMNRISDIFPVSYTSNNFLQNAPLKGDSLIGVFTDEEMFEFEEKHPGIHMSKHSVNFYIKHESCVKLFAVYAPVTFKNSYRIMFV